MTYFSINQIFVLSININKVLKMLMGVCDQQIIFAEFYNYELNFSDSGSNMLPLNYSILQLIPKLGMELWL